MTGESNDRDAEQARIADVRVKRAFEFGLLGGVLALLARYVPWTLSYVLGPAILVACGWFLLEFRAFFFFFRSEGSAAGMLVPLILWPVLALAVWAGWGLIKLGRHLLHEQG